MKKSCRLGGLLVLAAGAAFLAEGAGIQSAQKRPAPSAPPASSQNRILRNLAEYAPGAEGGKLQINRTNAESLMMAYLKKNESRLGLKAADLKLRKIRKIRRFWVATFVQHYRGVPVHGSKIGLIARPDGKIVSVGSNYEPNIVLDTRPGITVDNAVLAAARSLKLKDPGAVKTFRRDLMVFPGPPGEKGGHKLAWRFILESKKPNPFVYKEFFVEAGTGRILKSVDAVVDETLKAQVKGAVWPSDPTNATEDRPLSGLKAKAQGKETLTGRNGFFSLDGLSAGSFNLTLRLEGDRAVVYRNSGTDLDDFVDNEIKLQKTLRTGQDDVLVFPSSDETNVFYHLNRVQDWFIGTFEYTYECDWEREGFLRTQIIACCDSGPGVNGKGGSGGVWFGSEGGKPWARGADIIYHEFIHNVLREIFDDYIGFADDDHGEGYAMDEGFADYFACALTEDPMIGENVSFGPRSIQNEESYPDGAYDIEGHTGGMIISGACWDFRTSIDKAEADQLVFDALNLMAAWPKQYYFSSGGDSNFLEALLTASDGRYDQQIRTAFQKHGLAGLTLTASKETYGKDERASFKLKNNDIAAAGIESSQYFIDRESNGVWKEFYSSPKGLFKTDRLEASAAKTFAWDGWDNERKTQAWPGRYRLRLNTPGCIPPSQTVEFTLSFPYVSTDHPDVSPAFGGLSLTPSSPSFSSADPVRFVLKNWGMNPASLQGSYFLIEKYTPPGTTPGDRTSRPASEEARRWKEFFTSAKGFLDRPTLASQAEVRWTWNRKDNERLNEAKPGKYRIRLFVPKVTEDVLVAEFDLYEKRESNTATVIKR